MTGQTNVSVSSVVTNPKLNVTGKDYCLKTRTQLPVFYHVASHVPFAGGSSQKDVMPEHQMSIKSVKGVCVDHLSSVQNVTNAPLVVPNPPVGSRLHEFWEKWAALGVSPTVVSVLREGYTLPFRSRPYLTRKPTLTSCYADPHRYSYMLEALHQLLNKNAVELIQNPQSLGFYNRLFLVPKPNNRWRPILDLSKLNEFLKTQSFKMETPETIRISLQAGEWATSVDFQDAYFHTHKQPVQEAAFSHPRQNLPVQSTTLWPVHSSHGVHCDSQRGQMASNGKGYKDPPDSSNSSSSNTNPSSPLLRIGLASERGKIRAGTQTNFQFRRLPVRLERGQGQTHHRMLADPTSQDTADLNQSSVSGPEFNVPDRNTDCYRKTGTLGQATYETHTVAPQKQLESTGDAREDHPHSKITPPTSRVVTGGKQCYHRSTLTPSSTCSANLCRRIKRRVGHSLKRAYGKGKLVTPRKQAAHKLSRVKGSSSGTERVSNSLYKQGSPHSYRQHYCGSLHKQRRGNEVGAPMCFTLENTDLVHQ